MPRCSVMDRRQDELQVLLNPLKTGIHIRQGLFVEIRDSSVAHGAIPDELGPFSDGLVCEFRLTSERWPK